MKHEQKEDIEKNEQNNKTKQVNKEKDKQKDEQSVNKKIKFETSTKQMNNAKHEKSKQRGNSEPKPRNESELKRTITHARLVIHCSGGVMCRNPTSNGRSAVDREFEYIELVS